VREIAERHADGKVAVVLKNSNQDLVGMTSQGAGMQTYAEGDSVVGISNGGKDSSENEGSEHG
jgi:hypothetical protein